MDAKRRKHVDGGVRLPEDIVFELLARLPTKDLCRFRCVCKGWRALISDQAFITAQRPRAAADPHLVAVFLGSNFLPEVRLIDMDGNVVKAFEIRSSTPLPPELATRLDLICADGRGTMHGGIIIDPAAGEAFPAFGTCLGSDPSDMSYMTILGRAAPSGLFKVLRLEEPFMRDEDGGGPQLCEVATIMDGIGGGAAEPLTWRRRSAPPFLTSSLICEHRAIVNGVIYFIHELEIGVDVDEGDDVALNLNRIVAFDLESEEWKPEAINCPTLEHEEEGWSIALVALNGSLTFVHKVILNGHPYTSIWRLVDPDKSVWVKEYMIPMSKNQIELAKPLGALVDGRILYRYREVVQFYNPRTNVFTDFMEMTRRFIYTLVFYTGSLLS